MVNNTCKNKRPPPIIKRFCEKRGGQKIIHTPQNILEGNGVVFEILVKEKDPPSFKTFMQKTNYSYPSNILEGNRVVFETLVKKKDPPSLKKFHGKRGGQKILFIPPPNILEGNGVVFETFTINNLQL